MTVSSCASTRSTTDFAALFAVFAALCAVLAARCRPRGTPAVPALVGFADDARLLEELECRPFEELEPRPFDDPDPLDDDFAAVERFADDVASASITV